MKQKGCVCKDYVEKEQRIYNYPCNIPFYPYGIYYGGK